jgi:hypothetical protein
LRLRRRRQARTPAAAVPPVTAGARLTAAAAEFSPACLNVSGIGMSPIRDGGQMITNALPTTSFSGMVPFPGASGW